MMYPWEQYKAPPKPGQTYWYIRNDGLLGNVAWPHPHETWAMPDSLRRWDYGNVFLTREDALLAQSVVRQLLGGSGRRSGGVDSLDEVMERNYAKYLKPKSKA